MRKKGERACEQEEDYEDEALVVTATALVVVVIDVNESSCV